MQEIKQQLNKSIIEAISETIYNLDNLPVFTEFTKNAEHGDLYTNIALQLGSKYKESPQKIGEEIKSKLKKPSSIKEIRVESNGFINFFLSEEPLAIFYTQIIREKEAFGSKPRGKNWYFIEIVSANPTGILHIGHARNAIFSDTLANLLEHQGNLVHREYLINDLGNQIDELAQSVWVKYLNNLYNTSYEKLPSITYDTQETEDCAKYIVAKDKEKWGWHEHISTSKDYSDFKSTIISYFIDEIKKDLSLYNIAVNTWKTESSFVNTSSINDLLKSLQPHLMVEDKAIWFKVGDFIKGHKNEVLLKKDGTHTYFAQDLIYHLYKLSLLNENGKIINVWGSDHYGHINRLKGFFKSQNIAEDKIHFIPMQLVKLLKNGETVKISKRDSQVINIREMKEFLSYEEMRWFFVSQSPDSQLEIELEKLKLHDEHNPVHYILYAYARVQSILSKYPSPKDYESPTNFKTINTGKERSLLHQLIKYSSVLEDAANTYYPHKIPNFLIETALIFHSFYSETNLLNNKDQSKEWLIDRLALLNATRYIIKGALSILRIEAKDEL